jgi:NAD(P)H-nitrite reductase large subunit
VPFRFNHAIIEAYGKEHVESAKIARLDEHGAPIPGTEKQYDVDAVCLGYGLLPSFQLASAFGCKLGFDQHLGWFAPIHDQNMESTQPGIFVAGDVTDVAGSKAALVAGEIAGLNAIHQLGCIEDKALAERLAPLYARLRSLNRLADALHQIYAFRPGLTKAARDDTLLCRCEEITLGQVMLAVANGATDLHQVKLATRAGMGYCQGRFCSALIAPVIAEATGQPLSDLLPFTVRSPIQPIPLRVLASGVVTKVEQ